MLTTRLTELVGCTVSIQQAGMGWFAYPPLANAVAEAGGLGLVSVMADRPTESRRCSTHWMSIQPVRSGPISSSPRSIPHCLRSRSLQPPPGSPNYRPFPKIPSTNVR